MFSKKCKYFYEMDEIFSVRHNIVPPIIVEPGRIEFSLQDSQETQRDEME